MKYQNYYMGYIAVIRVEICTVNNYKVSKKIFIHNRYGYNSDIIYTIVDACGSKDEVMSATAQLENSSSKEIHLHSPLIHVTVTDSAHHTSEHFSLDNDDSTYTSKLFI